MMPKKTEKLNMMKFIEEYKEKAKELLIKSGRHIPTFFLEDRGKLVLIATPFHNKQEKDLLATSIKMFLNKFQSDFYIFICESYFVEVTTEEEAKILPSQNPNRRDCLIANFVQRDGRVINTLIPFKRKNNKVFFEEEKVIDSMKENTSIEGRFHFSW